MIEQVRASWRRLVAADQPWWSALYRRGDPFKCPTCGKTLQADGRDSGIDRDDQDLPVCSRCGTSLD